MTYFTIKTHVNTEDVMNMFKQYNREDNFTYTGLEAILTFLEETSEDGLFELDVIAICCEFVECSVGEVIRDYENTFSNYEGIEDEDGEYNVDMIIEILNEYTWAIELENGNILYTAF